MGNNLFELRRMLDFCLLLSATFHCERRLLIRLGPTIGDDGQSPVSTGLHFSIMLASASA